MMKNFKKFAFVFLAVLSIMGHVVPQVALASEVPTYADEIDLEDNSVLVIDGTQTPEEEAAMWEELFNNPDIESLIVIDPDLLHEDFEVSEEELVPQGRFLKSYRVNNVKSLANTQGGIARATSGTPGLTISLSISQSFSHSASAKFGASNAIIKAEVGYSVTGSTTVSESTSYKVPTKHNNKNVKDATLNARPLYQNKSFRVQSKPLTGGSWTTEGTGTATRPIGVAFNVTHTYK